MDNLIKTVAEKAGISSDQAKKAVDVVMKFLKDKLPGPIGKQVEGALKGSLPTQDLGKKLGGLLGKK